MRRKMRVFMNQKCVPFALFLCIFLLGILPQNFAQTQSISSQPLFADHFDGYALNTSKWTAQLNTNGSGLPANGGQIVVNNSYVSLSSTGSSFPLVTSAVNPFPTSGDFGVAFDITYDHVGGWGNGIWISQGPFDPVSSETTIANVVQVWADTSIGLNVFFFGNVTYKQDFYWSAFGYSAKPLNIRLDYSKGTYSLYLNGSLMASYESQIRPDTIGFGHPVAFWMPENASIYMPLPDTSYWSSFKIDSIKVLPSSQLSIFTSTPSSNIGNTVNINGVLSNSQNQPIGGATLVLSCLIPGLTSFNPMTTVTTDSQGAYSASWMPTATVTSTIKAVWTGDAANAGSFDVKNVSVVQGMGQSLFIAESNSTLSSLAFNSTSNEISFTVSGTTGTAGYVRFLISKQLMADLKTLRVYMDGQQTSCNVSSTTDAWQVHFVYHHSTHDVMIKLPESSIPDSSVPTASPMQQTTEPNSTQNVPQENLTSVAIIVGAIVALIAITGLLFYIARRPKKQLS